MRKQIRGISAGTVVMLAVTVLSVIGFILVMNRLSGKGADLSRLQMSALKLETEAVPDTGDILIVSADTQEMRADSAENTAPAGLPADAAEDAGTAARNSLTLTFGGTVAVESGIRKSCYAADSKKYDFSLLLNLMRDEFRGEGPAVFLENLLTDNAKMTDTVIPANAAEMLSEAGINLAAAGFAKAFDQGLDGLQATRQALSGYGVRTLGIRPEAESPAAVTLRQGNLAVTLLQYTETVPASVRKTMAKKDASEAIPEADADRIAADIRHAREAGADAVAVLLSWGKTGGKNPEKAQKALAWKIAEAGADLIIGAGSRIPQTPEWMAVTGSDGQTRQVLCVYSLGTLISDNRKAISRMSGYLLRVTFRKDGGVMTAAENLQYIPTYVWRYKQDGVYYYRCLAANRTPPDGMDSEQQKNMAKAAETIADVLEGSGIRIAEQP